MKHIFVKIIKYVIVFLGILLISDSYLRGVFHPKYFVLNGIKINAPKNTYLWQVLLNDEEKHNLFSPILLSSFKNYTLKQNEEIYILFANPMSKKEPVLLSIDAWKISKNKYMQYIKEVNSSYVKLLKSSSFPNCMVYQDVNKTKVILYVDDTKMTLSSYDKNVTQSLLRKICNKDRTKETETQGSK